MEIGFVGPWIVTAVGAAITLVGLYVVARSKGRLGAPVVALIVIGVVVMGVGVYGLGPIASFLQALGLVDGEPKGLAYLQFMGDVGDGDVDMRAAELGLAYILENPTGDLGAKLDQAISAATSPEGRATLVRAKEVLDSKSRVATLVQTEVLSAPNPAETLSGVDPATRALTSQKLLELSPAKLRELSARGLTTSRLEELAAQVPTSAP